MLLNPDKTVVINFHIDYTCKYEEPVVFCNSSVTPSRMIKFLGIFLDEHLTFIPHVDFVVKNL